MLVPIWTVRIPADHRPINDERVREIQRQPMILNDPIMVDCRTGEILDGAHRWEARVRLDLPYIAVLMK